MTSFHPQPLGAEQFGEPIGIDGVTVVIVEQHQINITAPARSRSTSLAVNFDQRLADGLDHLADGRLAGFNIALRALVERLQGRLS